MNKHAAVYMLNLRRIFYKVLLIILIMCIAEGILLYKQTEEFFADADDLFSYEQMDAITKKYMRSDSISISGVFTDSGAHYIFAAAYAAVCGVFILNGLELGGSRSSYTVRRLSLDSKAYLIWESLAYLSCIVIFYVAQVAVALGFTALYAHMGGEEYYSSQSALIMFYENEFLHSLLPLRDTSRNVRNIVMMLSLAVCSGCFSYRRRHGANAAALFTVIVIIFLDFPLEMGRWGADVMVILTLLTVTGAAVVNLWRVPDEG